MESVGDPEWEDIGEATATENDDDEDDDFEDDDDADDAGQAAPLDDLTELILALKCRA